MATLGATGYNERSSNRGTIITMAEQLCLLWPRWQLHLGAQHTGWLIAKVERHRADICGSAIARQEPQQSAGTCN